jgi:uncharacterized membrane protein YphA (DoxX/SURF4 family)
MPGLSIHLSPALLLVAIPYQALLPELAGLAILALGIVVLVLRTDWRRANALDKLILFGPVFYAAPIAAFGTEHFTTIRVIATLVPQWIPGHIFWAYFVGICLVAAGLSLATGIQARLAAGLLALMFFLFVVLMDAPGWLHHPGDRFITALMLREVSFCGGPLGFFVSLTPSVQTNARVRSTFLTIARLFIAIPILFYSFEQFLHADHVPGIPLELVTPTWIPAHLFWTYLTAAVYAVFGPLLLIGWKPRLSAAVLGAIILLGILAVYVPLGIVERASLDLGLNYPADTLMYCGTVLLLALAMPRESRTAQ